MDRRLFVKLSAFTAAAISFSLVESCTSAEPEKEMGTPDLLSHMLERDTIIDIGKAYLEKQPNEKSKDDLTSLLLPEGAVKTSGDQKQIHSFLLNQITKDFNTNNTIVVKGWILARTEARQCALFFLLQK